MTNLIKFKTLRGICIGLVLVSLIPWLGRIFAQEKIDISKWNHKKEYFVIAFVNYYDQYKKECRKDTSWITKDAYKRLNQDGSLATIYDIYNSDNEVWYIHRKPTLEGFAGWLRAKMSP